MAAPSNVEALRELLVIHRRTLAFQLQQLGQHTPAYAPPALLHGIANAQSEIARLKQELRAAGETIADEPNDSAPVHKISVAEKPVATAILSEKEQNNRTAMLQRVRATWVDGVLKRSLWNEARIALQLAERPDAVARPYGLTLQEPSGTATPVPATTRIIDLYDQQRGALLILGAPGGGKTTLLLELAEALLERATSQPRHAIPVVFNLSSWGEQPPALADWLVAQLNRQYDVPRTIAQTWVDAGAVLPLLDGLDEVATERRAACVDAINAYRPQHEAAWHVPMVVCCRMNEYDALPRLRQFHAVAVQALTHAQVDEYLREGGRALIGVRAVVKDDPTLYELLDTPLLLSIVTLAFADQSAAALRRASTPQERRRAVFDAYVERVFAPPPQGKGEDRRYPRARMLHYLAWLARQMQQRSQSIFYLEELRKESLAPTTLQYVYQIIVWLIFGPISGVVLWLVITPTGGQFVGLIFGFSGALGIGLIAAQKPIKEIEHLHWSWLSAKRSIVEHYASWRKYQRWLGTWLIMGMLIGLFGVWQSGLFIGLGGVLSSMLIIMLIDAIVSILSGGLTGEIDIDTRHEPNAGIQRSIWSGLIGGVISGLVLGLIVGLTFGSLGLIFGLTFGSINSLVNYFVLGFLAGFVLGCGVGLVVGTFYYGGLAVIQHYTLRLLLWRSGALPWNIAAMLDAAARRTLLRRVGGGWVFVHRMLLEYFAELGAVSREIDLRDEGEQ